MLNLQLPLFSLFLKDSEIRVLKINILELRHLLHDMEYHHNFQGDLEKNEKENNKYVLSATTQVILHSFFTHGVPISDDAVVSCKV